jgi:hypothetical protein
MLMSFLRVPLAALAVFAMVASAGAETLKDIRKVTVATDRTVSSAVAKQTVRQLKQAVRSTRRPVPLPKVTMQVVLSNELRGAGAQAGRNSAKVTVLLRDLAGRPVSSESFTVNSFISGRSGADKALANAIAQRVALAYHLTPAKAVPTGKHRSGKRNARPSPVARTATAAQATNGATVQLAEPVIIPSEAALTVRPRVRKPKVEANASAGAKLAPCVVIATTSCN